MREYLNHTGLNLFSRFTTCHRLDPCNYLIKAAHFLFSFGRKEQFGNHQKFGLIYVNLHCSILKVFELSSWIFPTFPKSIAWAVKPMNATKKQEQQKSSHFVSVFFVVLIFRAGMKGKSPESSLRCRDELHHIYLFIAPSIFRAIFSVHNVREMPSLSEYSWGACYHMWSKLCLVPVRRLSRPSRSMHFGDVSKTNGRETASKTFSDHVTRNASAAHNNEA